MLRNMNCTALFKAVNNAINNRLVNGHVYITISIPKIIEVVVNRISIKILLFLKIIRCSIMSPIIS